MGGGISDIAKWLNKRFIRIVIPYAICYFILEVTKNLLCGENDYLSDLFYFTTIGFWTEHKGFWFIALLVPLYLFTPLLYWLLEKSRNRMVVASVIILVLLVISTFENEDRTSLQEEIIFNLIFAFKRTTNFVLGLAIAPYCKQGKRINPWSTAIVFGTLFVLQVILRSYFHIYLFCNWCLTPILLILFCYMLTKLRLESRMCSVLTWFGTASLESYITNGSTQGIARWCASFNPESPIFFGHYLEYAIVVVLGISTAYLFHNWSQKIMKRIKI